MPWPSGCPPSAGPRSSSRPRASTGPRRCAWSTAGPTPTRATPTGWTPRRWPARCWTAAVPRDPGSTCPRCGTSSGTGRPGCATGLRRPAGSCWCRGRCCRDSAWRSTSSSTCGSARRPDGGGSRPTAPGNCPPSTGTTTRWTPPRWPTRWCWPTTPTARRCSWPAGSAELAGHPAVDDVPGDRDGRRQRLRAGARAQLLPAEPPGLLDLVVVDPQLLLGRPGHEAQHQRLRERPGLAGDVADVGDGDPDLLGDLPGHRRLGRLPRLHEPGQDRNPPRRPHRLAAQHAPVAAVVDQHDHRGVGAREDLDAALRVALHPAGALDRRPCAGDRGEPVALVPLDDADRLRQQTGVQVAQLGTDLTEPGPGVDRPATDAQRPRRTEGGVRDAIGLAQVDAAVGEGRLLVVDEFRPRRPLVHRHGAPLVDQQHPHRAALCRVGQRAGQVPAVVGGPGQQRDVGDHTGPAVLGPVAAGGRRVVGRGAAAGRDTHSASSTAGVDTSTGPRARSWSAASSASPTTTAVSPAGASQRREASVTSSMPTVASARWCSASQSADSPAPNSADRVLARPAWVAVPRARVPSRYRRADSSSASVTGVSAIRPSSYQVSSSAGPVTAVATSASTVKDEPAIRCSTPLRGL